MRYYKSFIGPLCQVVLFAALTPGLLPAATLGTRSQTFDVDPNWTILGNGINGNDFGFSAATNNAGGTAGEGGGRFTRSDVNRAYADTNLGGAISLDEPFDATGKFDFTNHNVPDFGQPLYLGHFGYENGNFGGGNKVGLFFNNGVSTPDLSWGVSVALMDGTQLITLQTVIAPNVDRTWSYTWDPLGGTFGAGRLTGTLSGPGGGTKLFDLTPEQRAIGVSLDAFGLVDHFPSPPTPLASSFADIFIDDLSYTVPEPSTWTLATFALLSTVLLVRALRTSAAVSEG